MTVGLLHFANAVSGHGLGAHGTIRSRSVGIGAGVTGAVGFGFGAGSRPQGVRRAGQGQGRWGGRDGPGAAIGPPVGALGRAVGDQVPDAAVARHPTALGGGVVEELCHVHRHTHVTAPGHAVVVHVLFEVLHRVLFDVPQVVSAERRAAGCRGSSGHTEGATRGKPPASPPALR